jgi:hypothetical protein
MLGFVPQPNLQLKDLSANQDVHQARHLPVDRIHIQTDLIPIVMHISYTATWVNML